MRKVKISLDEDIVKYLLNNKEVGETYSEVARRLLDLNEEGKE